MNGPIILEPALKGTAYQTKQVGCLVCVQPKALGTQCRGLTTFAGSSLPVGSRPLSAPLPGQHVQPAFTTCCVFLRSARAWPQRRALEAALPASHGLPSQARSCSEACDSYDHTRPVENLLLAKGLCLRVHHQA